MKNLVKNFSKEFDANYEDSTRPNAKFAKRYSLLSILDQLHWVISTKHKDASNYHAQAEEMLSNSAGDTWEEIKSGKVQLVMGKVGEKLEQQATCLAEAEMHQQVMNFFKDVLKTSCQEDYVPKALRKANAMQSKSNNNKAINNFQASLKVA